MVVCLLGGFCFVVPFSMLVCIFLYQTVALMVIRERDVALWYERSLMVRWVVGSILHGGPIELFLVPSKCFTTGVTKAVVCVIMSVG